MSATHVARDAAAAACCIGAAATSNTVVVRTLIVPTGPVAQSRPVWSTDRMFGIYPSPDNCPPKHLPPKAGVTIINASAYRPIGRYRRSKHRKSTTSLKLVADTAPRQLTLN